MNFLIRAMAVALSSPIYTDRNGVFNRTWWFANVRKLKTETPDSLKHLRQKLGVHDEPGSPRLLSLRSIKTVDFHNKSTACFLSCSDPDYWGENPLSQMRVHVCARVVTHLALDRPQVGISGEGKEDKCETVGLQERAGLSQLIGG